jgi:3',5'-cyclic AMP phosphodiesterase CpdA
MTIQIAVTADLHWGSNLRGDEATRQLVAHLQEQRPQALIVAGDIGAGERFADCLALFAPLECQKFLVPGNHDIWVVENDPRGDSLHVYQEHLPRVCEEQDFHYLDQSPAFLSDVDLALVGSINWYDYSWSIDLLRQRLPDWEKRLRTKVFSRGRHNDARYVRMAWDDVEFTRQLVDVFEGQLQRALDQAASAIVVTHHPPFYGLSFPRTGEPSTDALLWDAFAGNRALEDVLSRHADRIPFAFCGHTHRERENWLANIHGYNVGGDYHFKRLLLLDWPSGRVEAHTFGKPNG